MRWAARCPGMISTLPNVTMPDHGAPEEHARPRSSRSAGGFALGALFWIALWCVVASIIGNDLLFADPWAVLASLGESVAQPSFWIAIGNTAARIIGIGALSGLCGLILGSLGHRFMLVHQLFAPLLHVMKSAPVACIVVIVLVMWGAQGAFATIVAFVAFPPFYVAIQQALEARPRRTEEALKLLGVSRWKIFCGCIWPAALPFFTSASKTAVALAWRAGITAELLCLPLGSIGAEVYTSKLTLDSAGLLAWTITVMLLSWLNERIVLAALRCSEGLATWALNGTRAHLPTSSPRSLPAPTGATPVSLILEDVHKAYGDTSVLAGFSLGVSLGERICLMAPTGEGKSTALGMLARLCTPDAGRAHAPARIGIVMQDPTLLENLSAFQNVALAAGKRMSADRIRAQLASLIGADALDRAASELSGGTKRLTELVRALLSDGQAIVLDEPFTGLDPARREAVCAFIKDALDGRPLIVATHDPTDAALLDAAIVRL